MPDDRVQIFVDGSNFYHGLLTQFGSPKVDYEKLVEHILCGRRLVRAVYYVGKLRAGAAGSTCDEVDKQVRFHQMLAGLSFRPAIVTIPMRYADGVPREKGIDIRIATDMLMGAVENKYDVAVLLSGDSDFAGVCKYVVSKFHRKLELYFPNSRRHLFDEVRMVVSRYELIDKKLFLRFGGVIPATPSTPHNPTAPPTA